MYFLVNTATSDIFAFEAATGVRLPFQTASLPSAVSIAATPERVFAVGSEPCGTPGTGYGLCAFDASTGARVWTWTGSATNGLSRVWTGQNRVYVPDGNPGGFSTLRALDASTGALTSWSVPDLGVINDLVEWNGRVYVSATLGPGIMRVFAFDAATAADASWSPPLLGSLSVAAQGSAIAVGGTFRLGGGQPHRSLVALDLTTGRPAATPVPQLNGIVHALASYGDIVFVGVESAQPEVFAFLASTGQRLPWSLPHNGRVLAMQVVGQTLYVGGYFSELGGQARGFLGAVDLTTGALLPWNPALDFEVSELSVSSTTLYAAGRLRVPPPAGAVIRSAAFDLGSRQRTEFAPELQFSNADRYLATAGGRVLATSGPFSSTFSWLAPDTGRVIGTQSPGFSATFAAGRGDTFFVSGLDTPTSRLHIAALHAPSGRFLGWAPELVGMPAVSPGQHVRTMLVEPDLVAIGGGIERAAGRQVSHLGVFRVATSRAPWSVRASVAGNTASLSWLPNDMPVPESYLVEVGTTAGGIDVGTFGVGGATEVGGSLAAGRYFTRVRGVSGGGTGPASSEVILDVPSAPRPPGTPGTLHGGVLSHGLVSLTWSAATGNPTTYVVEAGTASGLGNLAVFPTGHLDTWLFAAPPPGTYVVRLRAANAFGVGPATNEVTLVVR